MIMFGMIIGSFAGGYLPGLLGTDGFSLASLLGSGAGWNTWHMDSISAYPIDFRELWGRVLVYLHRSLHHLEFLLYKIKIVKGERMSLKYQLCPFFWYDI